MALSCLIFIFADFFYLISAIVFFSLTSGCCFPSSGISDPIRAEPNWAYVAAVTCDRPFGTDQLAAHTITAGKALGNKFSKV